MFYGLILALHILVCFTLILVVLLQSGKGGGLSGAFGGMGGAGQNLFGGAGAATFLSKATTVLGVAFMTTSVLLALMGGGRGTARSILRQNPEPGTAPPPATSQPIQLPGAEGLIPAPLGEVGEGETGLAGEAGEPPAAVREDEPAPATTAEGN